MTRWLAKCVDFHFFYLLTRWQDDKMLTFTFSIFWQDDKMTKWVHSATSRMKKIAKYFCWYITEKKFRRPKDDMTRQCHVIRLLIWSYGSNPGSPLKHKLIPLAHLKIKLEDFGFLEEKKGNMKVCGRPRISLAQDLEIKSDRFKKT